MVNFNIRNPAEQILTVRADTEITTCLQYEK